MLWFAGLIGVIAGAALIPRWLKRTSIRVDGARLPVTPIEDVRDGAWVRIEGRIVGEPFSAPLTGRAVVWASSSAIVETDLGGRADEEHRRDFVLVDETGRALLRAADASTVVLYEKRFSAHTTNQRVLEFFERHGRVPLEVDPISCRETMVPLDATMSVMGLARWVPDPDGASTHREMARRLELVGTAERPLVVL